MASGDSFSGGQDAKDYVDGSSSLVLGCDSYTKPDELGDKELVMSMNCTVRGGIVQTRPGTRTVFCAPDGNFQGATLFTPSNGISQLIFAVDGLIYVSQFPFTQYQRLATLQFSNISKYMAWAVCLKSTDYDAAGNLISLDNPYSVLVMQDGLTRAAYWDGNTAAHLNPGPPPNNTGTPVWGYQETPVGLWMIWSGNRLWVSRGNQIFASDAGNPLKFTEGQYLNAARAFYLTGDCTGMIEVPTDANTSKGFIAFTETNGTLFQSYIQDRLQWLSTPLFQNTIIPTIGCVAPRSLVTQYGLNWWFGPRGLTNINSALRQNISSRLDYQDNEMFASKAYLSPDLSGICGVFYENYLMMSVPSQDILNRHTWVLDQAPFEGNAAAWCGYWSGWRPIEWTRGIVNGAERLFFASIDYDGKNRIWEAMLPERTDNGCQITCYAQLREHANGNLDQKRYDWSKFFLSQIYGDVDLNVYVASTKGSFQFVKGYHIVATEGAVFNDVQYSEVGPYMIGNIAQSRTIRTPSGQDDNACNQCGVESEVGNMIDYAFSHLLVWAGQMGLKAYQIHALQSPEREGGDCEADEVGPRSLNAMGCSGTELLVSGQFFDTFTARAEGVASAQDGSQVYLNFVGFSIISAANAQANADQRVVAVQNHVSSLPTIPPGVYGSDTLPWPDGGAGITPETDGGGALGGGSGGGTVIVQAPEEDPHTPAAPTIITQPDPLTVDEGDSGAFIVVATGYHPVVYQWQVSTDAGMSWSDVADDATYSGATTAVLELTNIGAGLDTYLYRCRVRNEVGQVYSDEVELTVTPPVSPFFQIPLSSLGDARAYITASDYCQFIGHDPITPPGPCGSYIFDNNFTPEELWGYATVSAFPFPPFGFTYGVTWGVSENTNPTPTPTTGKVAGAFNIPVGGDVGTDMNISGNLGGGGACSAASKTITINIYDEAGLLVATATNTDTINNVPVTMGAVTLAAGKYLMVLEYSVAAGCTNPGGFGLSMSIGGIPNFVITLESPVIYDQSTVQACGAVC